MAVASPSALCPAPNALPFLQAGCVSPPPRQSPSFSTAPFPAPGDSSEVHCSHEVWVKGSRVPPMGARPPWGPPTPAGRTAGSWAHLPDGQKARRCGHPGEKGAAVPVEIFPKGQLQQLRLQDHTWQQRAVVQSPSRVRLFVTPGTVACQDSLSFTSSHLKLMSVKSVMLTNPLHGSQLCHGEGAHVTQ